MAKRSGTPGKIARKPPKRRASDVNSEADRPSKGLASSRPTQSWTDSVQWLDDVSVTITSFLGAMSAADKGWWSVVVASAITAFGGGAYCALIKWALYGEDLKFSFFQPRACLMWAIGLLVFVFGMTPYELDVWARSVLFLFLTSWNSGILASFSASRFRRDAYMALIFVYLYCYGGGDTSTLIFHDVQSVSTRVVNRCIILAIVTATNLIIEHASLKQNTAFPVISSTVIFFSFAVVERNMDDPIGIHPHVRSFLRQLNV